MLAVDKPAFENVPSLFCYNISLIPSGTKMYKKKEKSHVQSVQNYCFSLPNMQIGHVLVVVAFVLAHKWPNVYGLATTAKFSRIYTIYLASPNQSTIYIHKYMKSLGRENNNAHLAIYFKMWQSDDQFAQIASPRELHCFINEVKIVECMLMVWQHIHKIIHYDCFTYRLQQRIVVSIITSWTVLYDPGILNTETKQDHCTYVCSNATEEIEKMKKALVSTFSHLVINKELKETRRPRKGERHLKM